MKIVAMKVELLDRMGTDLSIVNAARVSMAKESGWEFQGCETARLSDKDAKLVNYLANNNHWTPFGHCFATFRVKAPIFVARQLVKHQIGLCWNEVSRRYVDEEPEFWLPEVWRERPEGSIKQGSGKAHYASMHIARLIERRTQESLSLYQSLIYDNVAPEQARMVLPLNTMTEWIWSGSLAAWARVCKLRLDPHAQEETRLVAEMFAKELEPIFPVSWAALMA
jgi:thymidylate synthase (FAD)